MVDYITLLGAEDVSRAGSRMADAASTMSSAASNIDGALERHQRFMDDWLLRFESVVDKIPDRADAVVQAYATARSYMGNSDAH